MLRTHEIRSDAAPEAGAHEPRRGDAARQALIEAGIELFGRRGLDGATTRDIAQAARQNQAAIPYHFGSKEGLYLAVAEHLLQALTERNRALIEDAEALLADARATPAALLAALCTLTVGLVRLFTSEETLAVSRILTREQSDPTAVFDLFYERALGRVHGCVGGLLDRYSGLAPDPVDSVLRAHILFGALVSFRVGATTVLRRTGWSRFGAEEVGRIEAAACEHVRIYARGLRHQAGGRPARSRAGRRTR